MKSETGKATTRYERFENGMIDLHDTEMHGPELYRSDAVAQTIPDFDLNNINYVKIDDIYSETSPANPDLQEDTLGRPIYDVAFEVSSVGFDLEAVGVINQNAQPDPDPEPQPTQVPVPAIAIFLQGALLALAASHRARRKRNLKIKGGIGC